MTFQPFSRRTESDELRVEPQALDAEKTGKAVTNRRKRTSSKVVLTKEGDKEDIPLGEITVSSSARPRRTAQEKPRSILATEILANLAKFPHCILLTRVGQFYEVH